jgi:endonuclease III
MAALNRAALIAKTHKVLKQHYEPIKPDADRPLLQQMLFACCLENAPYSTAEKVYERLSRQFFDWNEVRVSTVNELSEVMKDLPDQTAAASNLKRILQGVFESTYSFELEQLKKQNLGQGIKRLQGLEGVTSFVLAYAIQISLGGHSIPLDRGALELLGILGIASANEVESGNVAGLERAIPKNKGAEFGSLLHQLAADYIAAPHSPQVKKIITAINPQAVIPKRTARLDATAKGTPASPDRKPEKTKVIKDAAQKTDAAEASKQTPAEKPGEKTRPSKQQKTPKAAAGKKPIARASAKKKSPSRQLAKRKPR